MLLLGGTGSRFNSPTPKQFTHLQKDSEPLFIRTAKACVQSLPIGRLIFVVNPEYLDKKEFSGPFEKFKAQNDGLELNAIAGGKSRHESFFLGCRHAVATDKTSPLAVHDANRPFILPPFAQSIERAIGELSSEKPCFIPVVAVADSICQVKPVSQNDVARYVPREDLRQIQTPQLLHTPSLIEAMERYENSGGNQNERPEFTDEGSFMMAMGFPVFTYEGDRANRKITFKEDI